MLHSLFNFHTYLLLNATLIIAYIIMLLGMNNTWMKNHISQAQRLKFARVSLLISLLAVFIAPCIMGMLPTSYHSQFQLEPILRSASASVLHQAQVVNTPILDSKISWNFSFEMLLVSVFLIGLLYSAINYFKTICQLKNQQIDAFCRYKIKNLSILFSNNAEASYCWSWLNKFYIVIPISLLENKDNLKIAIHHELQHIRQGDTHWAHFLAILNIVCFWNPMLKLWRKTLDELQEFSCDEVLLLEKQISAMDYANCLMTVGADMLQQNSLRQIALGINGVSKSILYRRVNMLFSYTKINTKKSSLFLVYIISIVFSLSTAYAFSNHSAAPLSAAELNKVIAKSHIDKSFQITVTPELVNEINNIRSSEQAQVFMKDAMKRMKQYQPGIEQALAKKDMPTELLVLPLVESGYKPLPEKVNPMLAAGIWQIIPTTAERLGLVKNGTRDDRLDTAKATQAALTYLQENQKQFNNWKLAVIAYEIGEEQTEQLIQKTHSKDPWVLARSKDAPESLKKFVAMFDAALIIVRNPELLSS